MGSLQHCCRSPQLYIFTFPNTDCSNTSLQTPSEYQGNHQQQFISTFSSVKLEFPDTIQVSKTFNGSNILLLQYFLWKHWDVFIQNILLFNGSNLGHFSNFPLLHSENGLPLSLTLMKWHKYSQQNFFLFYSSSNIFYFILFDKKYKRFC